MLVIVRPPSAWVRMGLVPRDTLWTIKKAVYGLRCSPKAWGEERDQKFRQLRWSIKGESYRLTQCINDSQVWKVIEDCGDEREQLDRARIVGLVICYVDDLFMLFERGEVRQEFTKNTEAYVEAQHRAGVG